MKNKLKIVVATLALTLVWLAPEALAYHQHNDNCVSNQWVELWSRHTLTDSTMENIRMGSDYSWTLTGPGWSGVKIRWDRIYDMNGVLIDEHWHLNDDAFLDISVQKQKYSCAWEYCQDHYKTDKATSSFRIKHSGNPACTNLMVYVTGTAWYRRPDADNVWLYDTNITMGSISLTNGSSGFVWRVFSQITAYPSIHWTFNW